MKMAMDRFKDNMSDNEIRILGSGDNYKPDSSGNHPNNKKKMIITFIITLVIAVVAIYGIFSSPNSNHTDSANVKTDTLSEETIRTPKTVSKGYISQEDTTINDIPLCIITPHNAKVELYIGIPPENDKSIILAAQAADTRADKDLPAGAFVHNGELISKGHSKYGFCAIIGNEITLGRQLETPLFEKAIENNGSFFRQYSLVSNGKLMNIPPKGKTLRRALCLYNKKIVIIETKDKESYHDFSQALVDIGVKEAIALVSGDGILRYRLPDGKIIEEGHPYLRNKITENYIIWK